MEKKMYTIDDLVQIMERLRGEGGCPWDAAQTHDSIKACMIEESYEAIDALEKGNDALFANELGDLLLQVVFHAQIAKEEGYKAIALTDHDTATGYAQLEAACIKEGMEYILGTEFSVCVPKYYHITAYGFDPEYPEMKKYLSDMALRQTDNTLKCFEEAVSLGNIKGITWDEVLEYNANIKWLCNNHVFETLKSKGLVEDSEYYKWFQLNFEKQRGKYPPIIDFLPLPELVKLIKKAGGIAIVAHPHDQLDDIDYLMEVGIEGIEVWHSMLTEEERERAYKIAMERNLFISGGSDHEGLCGGYYSAFATEEELKKSPFYIEPLSTGTTEHFFREIKMGKIAR